MATFFLSAAATRGSVRSTTSTEGFPFDPWTYDVRDGFGGLFSAAVNTNNTKAVAVQDTYTSGLDITTRTCARYFMAFDTSSITETVQSATLFVYKQSIGFSNGDLIPVKATAPTTSSNVTTLDYDAIFQYEVGYPMDSNTVGNVVDYADSPTASWVTGWNAISLNTAARGDINTLTEFKVALVNYTYDYLYIDPSGGIPGTNIGNGINALSNPPYIEIETGTGQWVLSINPILTRKVDGVTGTNIRNVNILTSYTLWRGPNSSADPTPPIPPAAACFYTGDPVTLTALYCAKNLPNITVGDTIYTDYLKTSTFNGGSLWWGLSQTNPGSAYSANLYQISSVGQVIAVSVGACFI
jgi:hypothetical protein